MDIMATASFADGHWHSVNPAFERILGWSELEALRMPFMDIVHPEDLERSYDAMAGLARGEMLTDFEHRVLCKDGSYRWIAWHTSADPEEGLMYCVGRDVTERRAAEAERERLGSLSEASARAEASERERISRELHDRVAHGIGVAYQSLELFSALRETDPERAEEKLELAREATRMALDRTRNISAELKRLQDEELAEGLQAAFEKLADTFAPDGTAMEVSFSGDQSAVAAPVGMQVYLAMREAVRNAVRHSGCSRIAVLLVVEDGELRARVEDDGTGFDPDTAEATPSWGVGLRSMRERAESLGGTLRVDSEPGEGTRVEMSVPLDGLHP